MTLKMSTEGNKTPLNFIMRVVWYLLGGRDFPVKAVHFISHPPFKEILVYLQVRLNSSDDIWMDVLFFVVDKAVKEGIDFGHHELGLCPRPVPWHAPIGSQ